MHCLSPCTPTSDPQRQSAFKRQLWGCESSHMGHLWTESSLELQYTHADDDFELSSSCT